MKTGPSDEAEAAPAAFGLLQHLGADDVGRHQVGGELDALVVEAEHRAQGLDEAGFGEAWHADQKRVAAGKERDQRKLDDAFLAENDGGRGLVHRLNLGGDRFAAIDELFFGGSECCHGVSWLKPRLGD